MNEHQYIVNEEKQREQSERSKQHSTPHKMAAFRGLLLLFVGLQLAQCKHAGGTLKLNSDVTEQYISKFSFTCKLRWLLPRRLRLQRAATAAEPASIAMLLTSLLTSLLLPLSYMSPQLVHPAP